MNRKKLSELSDFQLHLRIEELKKLIKIHQDYLKCTFNTFLGPFAATAEIKRCKKELEKVYNEMDKRDMLW